MSSYKKGSTGICPHCRHASFFVEPSPMDCQKYRSVNIGTQLNASGEKESVHVYSSLCPNCLKPILVLEVHEMGTCKTIEKRMIYPLNVARIAPIEAPQHIREDFLEAAAVLGISEKASAALSRRCLQNLLNE